MKRAIVLFSALLGLGAAFVGGGCPGGGPQTECECIVCSDAVLLSVSDAESGQPLEDFRVEVIYNGVPQGEPAACAAESRTDNVCGFGADPGLYHAIVSAPGYETREVVARVASEAASELCCLACLVPREIAIQLTPR